jgi:putative endonuclease
MFYVYILYSPSLLKKYIGHTQNILKRLQHHNAGLNRWSKRGVPWQLMYSEEYESKSEAFKREMYLKNTGTGRLEIKALISFPS